MAAYSPVSWEMEVYLFDTELPPRHPNPSWDTLQHFKHVPLNAVHL